MVTLSLCVDLISLKIACDFVMNSVHYSKNTSSVISVLNVHILYSFWKYSVSEATLKTYFCTIFAQLRFANNVIELV